MDNESTAWLMLGIILYSALYAWVCAKRFVAEVPQHDARVLPSTVRPPSPLRSSFAPDVSLDVTPLPLV